MEDNWVVIYASTELYKTEMVKALLEDHGIECVIMNKKDSAYMFGDIEVYVHTQHAFMAKQLILEHTGE